MGPRSRALASAITVVLGSPVGGPALAATPAPDGPEFVIRTLDYSTGRGAAVDEDGNYLVLWYEFFGGTQGRGYAADTTPGPAFQIEPYGANLSFDPMDVASLGVDDFVVVWEDDLEGLHGRRYSHQGTPLAPFFAVADSTTGIPHIEPAVARWRASSEILVTWASSDPGNPDPDGYGILVRAFDTSGTAAFDINGPPFAVNTYTPGDQGSPAVEAAADGSFLVVWDSAGSPGDDDAGLSVQGRWFSPTGVPGPQFQVNSYTPADQQRPVLAMAPDGRALVVWDGPSAGNDTDKSIQGRLVDALGAPVGSDFQINTTILGLQSAPAVVPRSGGGFHVAWKDSTGIFVQAVGADGALLGREVPVNSSENGSYGSPAMAGGPLGCFLVGWTDHIGPFRGQRFREGLFEDGFESGDISAWSVSVP